MQIMLLLLGGAAIAFWLLWWLTFTALRHAQRDSAAKQSCIDEQLELIEQLVVDRALGLEQELPDPEVRSRAREEVQALLNKV